MGSTKSRRKRRAEQEARKGSLIIFLVVLVILVMGGFFIKAIINEQKIDKATNCPTDGTSYHKAILIDTSQSYNSVQKKWIKNQLKQIVNKSEKHEKVTRKSPVGLGTTSKRQSATDYGRTRFLFFFTISRDQQPPAGRRATNGSLSNGRSINGLSC